MAYRDPNALREYQRTYYARNKERLLEAKRTYYVENKTTVSEKGKTRRAAQTEDQKAAARARHKEWKANNKDKVKAYARKSTENWRKANPDKAKAIARRGNERYAAKHPERIKMQRLKYVTEKRHTDPLFRLRDSIRSMIGQALREAGHRRHCKTELTLGMTFLEFKTYLESKFLPGMTWNNRREWHIDHVTPLAVARCEAEILALNHYTNLRPVWAKDNLSKSDTLPDGTKGRELRRKNHASTLQTTTHRPEPYYNTMEQRAI